MTDFILASQVKELITQVFAENLPDIVDELKKAYPAIDDELMVALVRAMTISSELSVQCVLRYLEAIGEISLPERSSPILTVLDNTTGEQLSPKCEGVAIQKEGMQNAEQQKD